MGANKKADPFPLTAEQVRELAGRLVNTGGNVYAVVRSRYGKDVGEAVFDRLWSQCRIAKCTHCDEWKDGSDFSQDANAAGEDEMPEACDDCLDGGM